ncbi:MAG: RDD family protein [Sporichthyaceae bacterium]
MDRRMLGSWLSGPQSYAEATGVPVGYPGERLGLPETGPNSASSLSRRLAATLIDWTLAQLIVLSFASDPGARAAATLGVFALMNVVLISTLGSGIGGRLLGIRVARLDGSAPAPISVLLRTFLIACVVPALVWDRDSRGLHDRWAYTLVVRR